jgi:outer membrane receptor protein involved in Fe transport
MIRFKFLLAATLLLVFLSESPLAFAESVDADPYASEPELEEIIVTGSRIKRRDYFTPSPLMTVSKADIDYSGQWTLEETLNQMPQVTPDYGRASNNPGNGMAQVALRNMGPGRSLVLLNGRRVGPSDNRSAVDINNIPQVLVERVEIITGGTSAVYGADALAGVVNFITRTDFSGLGIEASASSTERGDGEAYDLSVIWGHNFDNGRGNVSLYGGLYRREASYASDRELTRVAWREDGEGDLYEGGSGAVPATQIIWPSTYWSDDPEAEPSRTTFDANGNPIEFIRPDDFYNYAPENYLQVPLDRLALGIFANYQLSDRYEGYLEASYTHTEGEQRFAAVPGWALVTVNLDNPILTPATAQHFSDQFACDVNHACMYIGRNLKELGPRLVDTENDYYRITAGVRGDLGRNWEIDAWATYTRAETMRLLRNDASYSRFLQGLLVDPATGQCFDTSGGCVPLDIFGENRLSPEAVEFIRYPDFENPTERTHKLASLVVSGDPVSTWAGPVSIAAGLEWRSDESVFLTDEALFTFDTMGFVGASPGGGRDSVTEVYLEGVVPLLSNRPWTDYLGIELGARYSDYKYAGGVWSYKAGMEWQPWSVLRLRAMHQRSVRAPNSFEMFEEQRTWIYYGWLADEDPCTASNDPVGTGGDLLVQKCVMQGLPEDQVGVWEAVDSYPAEFVEGGNPDLEPEVGHTWTLGAVITPAALPDWTFAVDYFVIELDGAIGDINTRETCFDEANVQHLFCDRIFRDESGNVAKEIYLTGNRGIMDTSGLDLQASGSVELNDAWSIGGQTATLGVNLIWTHLLSFEEQESPVSSVFECAGFFGGPCQTSQYGNWGGSDTTYTRNRVRTSVSYTAGPLDLYLAWRWIEGSESGRWEYKEAYPWVEDLAIKSVSDRQYLDLGAGFSFTDHVSARLGVNNVFDTDPPNMADNTWDNNTDTGLYDVFGRSYYLTLSMQY